MAYDTILYEVTDAVGFITLNRPEVRNAQNEVMKDELDAAFRAAETDDSVRVVVLRGAGACFSAGHDLKQLPRDPESFNAPEGRPWFEGDEQAFREFTMNVLGCFFTIHYLSKPTVAQVHGPCPAGGWVLASMCDLIVAAEDATFYDPVLRMATAGVEILIEPWDLGPRKAKELMWTGEAIDAAEALRMGMVNRVVPREELDQAAAELARKVALTPPGAVRATKRSINQMLDLMGWRLSHEQHTETWIAAMRSDEHKEAHEARSRLGLRDFLRRRDSRYA